MSLDAEVAISVTCPICNESFDRADLPAFCPKCAWDLKSEPTIHVSIEPMSDEALKTYNARISLMRNIWEAVENLKHREAELEKRLKEQQNKARNAEQLLSQNQKTLNDAQKRISDLESKEEMLQRTKDQRYEAMENGIVKDHETGLEWIPGPDKDTTWNNAEAWVKGLNVDGGGWRLPTLDELEGLYDENLGERNMTPLLKTTGLSVWSGNKEDPFGAGYFYFNDGLRRWTLRRLSSSRAFAVRSRRDG